MDGLSIDKYSGIVVAGARATKNNAWCRYPGCRLKNNELHKGKEAIAITVKGVAYFFCPACALQFAADLKAAAESVMSSHDVARALLSQKQE